MKSHIKPNKRINRDNQWDRQGSIHEISHKKSIIIINEEDE